MGDINKNIGFTFYSDKLIPAEVNEQLLAV